MDDLELRAARLEKEKHALLEMGEVLVSELDPDRLLRLVAEKTRELIGARRVLIPLIDDDLKTYSYRAGCGEHTDEIIGESLPIGMGVCGWVWKHRRPWWHGVLEELNLDERSRWEAQVGNTLLVPLIGKQDFLGGIACIDKNNGDDFDVQDLALLKLFAQQVALAIENATLFNNMERKVVERTRELQQVVTRVESANKMKSEFLANMSHEIRTPLTAIIGYAECTLESGQTMEQRLQAIRTIISSGRHLLSLINDILDLAKVEADHLVVESILLSPVTLLEEVGAIIRSQAGDKSLAFSVDYCWPIPAEIYSDPMRLKQILINLCSNALKFTHQGEIRLSLGCDDDGQTLVFKVSDTGIGMSEDQQEKIFGQFAQADVATTREYGGTGLGLYLSRQLAEKLGGILSVQSAPGQGSCFTLTLKADLPGDEEWLYSRIPAETCLPAEKPQAGMQLRGHVLLAEDNEINQQLISHMITRTGADVTVVNNGEEAVHTASLQVFDLVLMDIQMPVMDGLEATRWLRSQGYDGYIVALTANVMSADITRYKEGGFNTHLAKPLDQDRFLKILREHLRVVDEPGDCSPIYPEGDFSDPALAGMLERFLVSLSGRVSQMRDYLDASDWDNLESEVHNLKGMGGSFGFPQLTELAGTIQFEMTKESYSEVELSLQRLERLVEGILLGRKQTSSVSHPGYRQ